MPAATLSKTDVMMSPSILSADFMALRESVSQVSNGADFIHVDVMDGHFVPNLTIGPMFVKGLAGCFSNPLDVHLMVDNPESTCDWYIDAGASLVTAQLEALTHANRFARHVRERGALAGIAINPATPVCLLRDVVEELDVVLVMSVNPGFGGQSYITSTARRIRELRDMCANLGCNPVVEVDGGIGVKTAPLVCEAGANMLVAGSAIFGAEDPHTAMEQIRATGAASLVL